MKEIKHSDLKEFLLVARIMDQDYDNFILDVACCRESYGGMFFFHSLEELEEIKYGGRLNKFDTYGIGQHYRLQTPEEMRRSLYIIKHETNKYGDKFNLTDIGNLIRVNSAYLREDKLKRILK